MEKKEFKKSFIDENTGIEYNLIGDYYLPNLVLSSEFTTYTIRKYGKLKLNYLKHHKKADYEILLMNGNLNKYLHNVDKECEKRIKGIITELAKTENVNEELKANDQMEWVCQMNNIKNRAEEIVLKELIYV